jgi:ActR/RegA family two-component response regulator
MTQVITHIKDAPLERHEILKYVKENQPEHRLSFITLTAAFTAVEALRPGARYLVKPFDIRS